jgi:Ala-tRNA(Pro) deacylase
MPIKKLKDFLDKNGIKYISISHSLAYTAPEIAASAKIHGKEMAKTVIVKIDGKLAMAVLPTTKKVDTELLKKASGAKDVLITKEDEFKDVFPECDIGAMPPFGNLYGMDVFVDESLGEDREIAFNAGTHTELIKMAYGDFFKLANPRIAKFSTEG